MKKNEEKGENIKGIPEFWLNVFKNADAMDIQEKDEEALKALIDVTLTYEQDPLVNVLPVFAQ